jgi:HK97 family phage prohead protease
MSDDKPRAPIELRSATVSDVRFPERIVDLVVVPYDEWAPVEYRGRLVEESFAPGAFGNVQNRAHKFLVNLAHDRDRVVGRVLSLDPDASEGLRSELLIRRGVDGDQVLDDAADGMLGGSVGFAALPSDQQWETRDRRRIVKAYLDHIGLVFTPAYQSAQVVSVRSAPTPPVGPVRVATPNLDAILAARLEADYSSRL